MSTKSIIIVTLQLGSIAYVLATGPWTARGAWMWVEIAGGLLAAWALFTMPLRQLRVHPEIAANAQLVNRGPYRWVRHPMYLALMVTILGLVGYVQTPTRWAAWAVLVVVLVVKTHYEEELLTARFPEYPAYRQRTKRLIPFVY